MAKSLLFIISFQCLLLILPIENLAQIGGGGESTGGERDTTFKFIPIPYINYDRAIGFSFGALPMAMYPIDKSDTISPSSISGVIGIYSTSKTWFAMGFSQHFLREDKWRVTVAGGLGNINYQFYIPGLVGDYIQYSTEAKFAYLKVQRKITGKFYGGLNFVYLDFKTEFGKDEGVQTTTVLRGFGIPLSYDNRSNVYYPRKGFQANITLQSYPGFMSNDNISTNLELEYDHYLPFRNNNDVLGLRIKSDIGIGDLFFNQQNVVGQTDIRGYSQGKYRGDQVVAIQGEYRWNPFDKIGVVGFLGFATVFNSINNAYDGLVLPGLGTGFRYTVFNKNKMNVGLDVAVGRDDWGLYFRIGEAF